MMLLKNLPQKIALTLFVTVLLFSSAELRAGASNKSGNPYGNGTFFSSTALFSGVIRGENLSGTVYFNVGNPQSTNTSTNNNSLGQNVIIYQGNTYVGNAAGTWDPSSGAVNGQLWGGQTLSGSNSAAIYPEVFNTNSFPVLVPIITNQVQNLIQVVTNSTLTLIGTNPIDGTLIFSTNNTVTTITVGTTNVLLTNFISLAPAGTNNFFDSVYMNGYFAGKTENKYPNQTFSAQGTVTQQQLGTPVTYNNQGTNGNIAQTVEGTYPQQLSSVSIPITVQGTRVADSFVGFPGYADPVPYSTTTYTVTNPPQ